MIPKRLKTPVKFTAVSAFVAFTSLTLLNACGGINDSWEVKGGGYFKYSVNGSGSYTIELDKDDVEPPYYVNNSHHYFLMRTRIEESERGDQFSLMVNKPTTGTNLTPVYQASVSGKYQVVSWMRAENSIEAPLIPDSSVVKFDEIVKDSLWTADVDLYFRDCRSGSCNDSQTPLHIVGRFRYYIPADERK